MDLQPLKIPAGWAVEWNLLTETDPTPSTIHEFSGNLLLVNSASRLKAIEVSWQPECDITGQYQLVVICLLPVFNPRTYHMEFDGMWEHPELKFHTKSRTELVHKINDLLCYLKPFKDPRILLKPGVVDLPNETLRQDLLKHGPDPQIIERIMSSQHKKLQDLLLEHLEISKSVVEKIASEGVSKGLRNKAAELLNSHRFKN